MAAPNFTLTDNSNNPLQTLAFGTVDAGTTTAGIPIRIWNNLNAASGIQDALNPTITTKTFNQYDNGDTVPNGNEIVVNNWIQIQCTSLGQTMYAAIGGPTTAPIADAPQGSGNPPPPLTIHSGNFAALLIRANIPTTATSTSANFLLRLNYSYS